jgi:phosphocarrier protein
MRAERCVVSEDKPDTLRQRATFEITNRLGLHARAAALFAETANRFTAEVTVTKDGQVVSGKSIMELMMLAAAQGSTIEVSAAGPDAEAAIEAIGELIADRFREES